VCSRPPTLLLVPASSAPIFFYSCISVLGNFGYPFEKVFFSIAITCSLKYWPNRRWRKGARCFLFPSSLLRNENHVPRLLFVIIWRAASRQVHSLGGMQLKIRHVSHFEPPPNQMLHFESLQEDCCCECLRMHMIDCGVPHSMYLYSPWRERYQ